MSERKEYFSRIRMNKLWKELKASSRLKQYLADSYKINNEQEGKHLILEFQASGEITEHISPGPKNTTGMFLDVPVLTYEEMTKKNYKDAINEMESVFVHYLDNYKEVSYI